MRKTLLALGAIGALFTVSACADDYGTGYYGAGYGVEVGAPDVYYDGFYGPYANGYWGPDDYFYYQGGDGRFLRDENRHFRHEMFEGARGYHAGRGDRDDDRR